MVTQKVGDEYEEGMELLRELYAKAIQDQRAVWFSNTLTHPHDKSGGFQFIQRTLDRHATI